MKWMLRFVLPRPLYIFGFLDDVISSPGGGLLGEGLFGERRHDQQVHMLEAQMGFQERMRNTAYRAATRDMMSAGLNPMLAYQQGGAHSPAGGSAQVEAPPPSIATAVQARRVKEEVKLLEAQRKEVMERARREGLQADLLEGPGAIGRGAGAGIKAIGDKASSAREAVTDLIEKVTTEVIPNVRGSSAGQFVENFLTRQRGNYADVIEAVANLPERAKSAVSSSAEGFRRLFNPSDAEKQRRKELSTAVIPPARRRFDAGDDAQRRKPRMRGKLGGAENY